MPPLGIVYATLNPRGRQIVLARGLLNGGLPLLYLPDQFRFTLRGPSLDLGYLHHGFLPHRVQSTMCDYSLGQYLH